MSYEEALDRRIHAWLADGPVVAPERAIDTATAHALRTRQRRGIVAGLRRALMSTVPLSPVVNHAPSKWAFAAAAGVVVLAVGTLIFTGLPRGEQRGGTVPGSPATPPSTQAAAPTHGASSVPAPTFLPVGAVSPAFFTAQVDAHEGSACATTWCQFAATISATDARITGPWVFDANTETSGGSLGTAVGYEPGVSGGGYLTIRMLPADRMTWEGEWFGGGPNTAGFKDGLHPIAVDPSDLWPIATIWLHGRNANEGLTAWLRMTDATTIEGWIFQTPTSH